jgi:toxin ParE1/3/4
VKEHQITLSEAAVADILEQAEWYEAQANQKLAKRWEKAVTSTLLRISRRPHAGSPCSFSATELRGARRVPVAGFPKHLVFYQSDRDQIVVLRIVHGARGLESLFTAP